MGISAAQKEGATAPTPAKVLALEEWFLSTSLVCFLLDITRCRGLCKKGGSMNAGSRRELQLINEEMKMLTDEVVDGR